MLEVARRHCIASDRGQDAAHIHELLTRIAVVRDDVASDYDVSPANSRGIHESAALERLDVTERLSELCLAVADEARRDGQLTAGRLEEATSAAVALAEVVASR